MRVPAFELERFQSVHEHHVRYNLSESGVHPLAVRDLVDVAGTDALLDVSLGYAQTNGPEALRNRIADFAEAKAPNVLVTTGTIEANFVCAWHIIEPGDEVLYMVPNYLQIGGLANGFGAAVTPFTLREEYGWQPDLVELESLVTDKTKLIALVNPNNPTGVILEERVRRRILELASDVGAWLLVDEIYRGSEHDGRLCSTFYGQYDRTIITGGLSKAFGLPGLRVGWVVGPEEFISDLWGRKDYTSITCATLSYLLAERALEPEMITTILARNREHVARNLDILTRWSAEIPGVHLTPPNAGAMALVRYDHDIASTALTERLRTKYSVLVVPGAHFGMEHHVRIGYGIQPDDLRAALELVGRVLEAVPRTSLSPAEV